MPSFSSFNFTYKLKAFRVCFPIAHLSDENDFFSELRIMFMHLRSF